MTAQRRLAGDIQPTFTLEAIRELQDSGVTALPPIVLKYFVWLARMLHLEADLNRLRAVEDEAFTNLTRLQFQARSYLNTLPPRVEEVTTSFKPHRGSSPEEQIPLLRQELGEVTRPSVTQTRDIKGEAAYIRKLIPVATAQAEFDNIASRVATLAHGSRVKKPQSYL